VSTFALVLVLTAAVLHASWNALVKAADDRAVILGAVSLTHAIAGVGLILISPPPAVESWPAIVTSEEVPTPIHLDIKCSINGVERQSSNTSQLVRVIRLLPLS